MSRRPRGAGNARGVRGGGRGGGVGVVPPTLEAPELVPGLMAWFDSRNTDYFALGAGGEVNAWLSRAGTLGSIAWQQGVGSNQPIRVAAEPLFNGMPAVQFGGVNHWLATSNQNAWTFLHNGSGSSWFTVERLDSTGAGNQGVVSSMSNSAAEIGVSELFGTSLLVHRVSNGTGTSQNAWNLGTASHYARDVSRWRMAGHVLGTRTSAVSGSTLTNPDTGGQTPSAAAPTTPLRLGRTSSSYLKGYVPQLLFYNHVLTAGEAAGLAAWASIFGVAA